MKTIVLAGAVALGLSTGAAFALTSPSGDVSTDATPARISYTVAGAGSVLAAPTGFRTLLILIGRIHPVLAAARKPVGTTTPGAIIPRQCEKCALGERRPGGFPSIRHCSVAALHFSGNRTGNSGSSQKIPF
jgi:hypothetical protein